MASEVLVKYGTDQSQSIDQLDRDGRGHGCHEPCRFAAERCGKRSISVEDRGDRSFRGMSLLKQGSSSMAGQKLTINLKDGTGVMSRVA